MRPRALVLLLPLTAGDYLLWDWSVSGSHDVLALVSGMTLLPLAALSAGLIGVGALKLVALGIDRSRRIVRPVHTASPRAAERPPAERPTDPMAERDSSSERKLAA